MKDIDTNIEKLLADKINTKTKPVGSLGKLEKIAFQIGKIQQTLTPKLIKPAIYIFAGDHGLTEEGISPFPKEVTFQMVMNFLNRGAAINVFSQQHDIDLKVVDAGVDFDFAPHDDLINAKIRKGTRNILREPAMTTEEVNQAMDKGKLLVQKQQEKGTNIIGFGEMGIGNTSSAALLMHKCCGLPIEECVGKGTGLDDQGMAKKITVLKKASEKYESIKDPVEILTTLGGLEIAMMTGAMLEAFQQNMIILIDGFIASSALLVAHKLDSEILNNCIFCHQSDEKGHQKMLSHLNADPLLNLGMRLGEGTGVAVAYPIIQSAVNFLNEMASFEEAAVANKKD